MSWVSKRIENLAKGGAGILISWASAKFFGGVAIGIFLAGGIGNFNWKLWGWLFVIVAVLASIPSLVAMSKVSR